MVVFETLKSRILYHYNAAIWLISLVSSYLVAPDLFYGFITAETVKFVSAMVVTALILVLSFLLRIPRTKAQKKKYLLLCVGSLLIGISSLLYYLDILKKHTVEYPINSANLVVIGNTYTANVYKEAEECNCGLRPSVENPKEVLQTFIPDVSELDSIWPKKEIQINTFLLIGFNLFTLIGLITFLIFAGYISNLILPVNPSKKENISTASMVFLVVCTLFLSSKSFAQVPHGCSGCRELSRVVPFEQTIQEELDMLNTTYKANVRVYIGKSRNHANKEIGIVLSEEELKAIQNTSEVKLERVLVRLVLSHEYHHIIQFLSYQNELTSDLFSKMRMECESDIFAGIYLYRKLIDSSKAHINNMFNVINKENGSLEKVEKYMAKENAYMDYAFRTFFNLSDKFENTYHPSSLQRLRAAKLGYAYGSTLYLDTLRKFHIDLYRLSNPNDKITDNEIMSKMATLYRLNINYSPYDNQLTWIRRQSKRIVHYDLDAVRYIEFKDVKINFHGNSNNNIVTYSWILKNRSTRPIFYDYTVSSDMVNREKPDDMVLSMTHSSMPYIGKLLPGESIQVKDTLTWFSNRSSYPKLFYPKNPYAFYSFEYADKEKTSEENKPILYHFKKKDLMERLPVLMNDIALNSSNGFFNIMASPMFSTDYSQGFTCFSPEMPIFASINDSSIGRVTIDLFNSKDKTEADGQYYKVEKFLHDFSDYIKSTNSKEELYYYFLKDSTKSKNFKSFTLIPESLPSDMLPHYWILVFNRYEEKEYAMKKNGEFKDKNIFKYEVILTYYKRN